MSSRPCQSQTGMGHSLVPSLSLNVLPILLCCRLSRVSIRSSVLPESHSIFCFRFSLSISMATFRILASGKWGARMLLLLVFYTFAPLPYSHSPATRWDGFSFLSLWQTSLWTIFVCLRQNIFFLSFCCNYPKAIQNKWTPLQSRWEVLCTDNNREKGGNIVQKY